MNLLDTKHFWRRAISRVARETLFRDMDDSAAFELLARTAGVLDELGISWWLTDGTLLGFVRDGGFIGHDIDVDIGLHARDYSPGLERAFERAGLEIYGRYGDADDGLEMTLRSRWLYLPGTSIDLFFFYEREDFMWHAAYYKGMQLRYLYPRFETTSFELRGVQYRVPDPPRRFLEHKYGRHWERPDPGWNNMLSPASLSVAHLPPKQRRAVCDARQRVAVAAPP